MATPQGLPRSTAISSLHRYVASSPRTRSATRLPTPKIIEKLFEVDPDETVLSFADMMKKKIAMPAHLMFDGRDDNLFEHFPPWHNGSGSTPRRTTPTYWSSWSQVEGWRAHGAFRRGRKAQDFVCNLVPRIRRIEERAQGRAKHAESMRFWLVTTGSRALTFLLFVDGVGLSSLLLWC
ncbi:hypothetical protein HPP92_006997 [Vanilla planifolia]|uniref:acyl-[acyl-carrier-protein] 4-desaturase n=1 Tax=Vanilla planifolia TaxID=51239 RepID=A0A835V9M9_VANPL|nr:hypothetical protein HPP92_006997 [Vanilla planifolia]